jgi:4-aminobutyrate aminotransferase/(S)-3-amino-2-methylpropionate transaminase
MDRGARLKLQKARMEAISTGSTLGPTFVRGSGPWLFTARGERYFDATSGSGAVGLGHQHPAVLEACQRQLQQLVHTGCKLKADVRDTVVRKIAALVPFQEPTVLFTVIGTEAVESAIKIARAATGRQVVAGFRHAFHGKSREALNITWRAGFKAYSAISEGNRLILDPLYSDSAAQDEGRQVDAALNSCFEHLQQARTEGRLPAAMIFEPIQVTEGVLTMPKAYIEGVLSICRQFGIISILDEIYTGIGRCGHLLFSDQLQVKPDLLLLGKSLGNGFPISVVVGSAELVNQLPAGVQTSTYSGHPLSCAAASAVLDVVTERALWKAAVKNGLQMKERLVELQSQYPQILRVRQCGMLLAFDLGVEGVPQEALAKKFLSAALAQNVLLFGGGPANATVKVVPPTLLTDIDRSYLLDALESTFLALRKES